MMPSPGGWVRVYAAGGIKVAAAHLVVILSCATGILLAWLATAFDAAGPLVLIALPAAPLLAAAVISDPRVAIIGVAVTFPVGSVAIPSGVLPLGMTDVAVVVAIGTVGLYRLTQGRSPLAWSPQLGWILLLVFWTLIAFPSAVDKTLAVNQIGALALGVMLIAAVVAMCRTMRDVKIVLVGFIAVVAAIAAVALFSAGELQSQLGGTRVTGRLRGAFDHPNQLGAISALFGLSAVGLFFASRSTKGRLAAGVAVALCVGALGLSLSRGAWIAAALGVFYLVGTLPRARRALLLGGLPLIVGGILLSSQLPSQPHIQVVQERLSVLTVPSPYDDRPAIWAEALREIKADPLTGQGPGGFPVASVRSGSEASTVFAYHAHNIWLTWAAESGLPAMLLLIGFMISIARAAAQARRAAVRQGDRGSEAMIVGLAAGLLTVVGQGPLDYTWRNTVVFYAICTAVGLLLGARRAQSARGSTNLPEEIAISGDRSRGGFDAA